MIPFLCHLGGALSLFTGMSIFSVVEIAFWLVKILFALIKKPKSKQNKSVQHEKTSKRNFLKKKMATEGPYACSKCFKRYRNKEKFVIHFKNFHMDHSDSEEIKHFREAIKKQKIV